LKKFAACLLVCGSLTFGLQAPALAEDPGPDTMTMGGEQFVEGVPNKFTSGEIEAATLPADSTEVSSEAAASADELSAMARDDGAYVPVDSIDVVELVDGAVIAAVPDSLELVDVTLTYSHDFGEVEVGSNTRTDDSDDVALSGPGMAPGYYAYPTSEWILNYNTQTGKRVASAQLSRSLYKVTNDGQTGVRYIEERTAIVVPTPADGISSNNFGDEVNVRNSTIQTTPSTQSNIVSWMTSKINPAITIEDHCNSYDASLTFYGAFQIGGPFATRCDNKYVPDFDPATPGRYALRYSGNNNERNVESSYTLGWVQKDGTAVSQKAYTSFVVSFDPNSLPYNDVYLDKCAYTGVTNHTCIVP